MKVLQFISFRSFNLLTWDISIKNIRLLGLRIIVLSLFKHRATYEINDAK